MKPMLDNETGARIPGVSFAANRETERTTPRGYRRTPTTPTTRTLHKDRTGGDLFLFAHLTVEVSVLFIYYKSLTFV